MTKSATPFCVCLRCGATFLKPPGVGKPGFCSAECRRAARNEQSVAAQGRKGFGVMSERTEHTCRTCRSTFLCAPKTRHTQCPECRARYVAEVPKRCRNCDALFWLERRAKGSGPYVRYCESCHPQRERIRTLGKKGITQAKFDQLLADQGGGCAICGDVECSSGKSFAIDHDHACCPGKDACGECVRGLLCGRCNTGLGNFLDSPKRLSAASSYIIRTRQLSLI